MKDLLADMIGTAYVRIPGDTEVHETNTLSGLNLVVVGQCACGKWAGWWVKHRGYISDGHGWHEEIERQSSYIPCVATCCGTRFVADTYLTVADGEMVWGKIVNLLQHPGIVGPAMIPC